MTAQTSFKVHVYRISVYKGARGRTYTCRWEVDGNRHRETFKTRALAENFRAGLLSAANRGEAFDIESGRPVSQVVREEAPQATWYDHACDFAAMKWPRIASKSRTALADALASITTAMVADREGRPESQHLRQALYGWAFNVNTRKAGPLSGPAAPALPWIEAAAPLLPALTEPGAMRPILDALSVNLDGRPAAANTVNRRRMVLHSALEYAVELGRLAVNPLDRVKWEAPKTADEVDRRVVVNPTQARALLDAVGTHGGPSGPALVAFFGCLYYAAMRPEEAAELHEEDCQLPAEGWGELLLAGSAPWAGSAWTDDGSIRDSRQLKHRAKRDTRRVPAAPELVALLRRHLEEHGTTSDGRLFRGAWGGPVSESSYGRAWRSARQAALTPVQAASPLVRRPYDLRHAAVSLWLNAGVPPQQVAEWAGHSVHVLLRVYAKCVDGEQEAARARIEAALKAA